MVTARSKNKKKLLILFIIFFIIGGFLGIVTSSPKPKNHQTTHIPKTDPSGTSQRITIKGEVVCLPHKDSSGPQTMECAYGIKTADGEHYVLDTGMMATVPTGYDSGDFIQANGIITPIEQLSTDQWMKYEVKGIFSATDSFEKIK